MKTFLLPILVPFIVACTKLETTKPSISMSRSGVNNELVTATGNLGQLPPEKVLYYGVQFDSVANTKIEAAAKVGLPGPVSFSYTYDGSSGLMSPGHTYYFRSFVGLKTGELLVSEPLEFIY